MIAAVPVLLLAALAAQPPAPAAPAGAATLAAQRPRAPDSTSVLRRARSAQERFERLRRRHLPWTDRRGGSDCDEIVGRFCFTHDDEEDDDDWVPPPEPEPVARARAVLLAELGEAAGALPGDGWVAGQQVRYLAEAGRHAEGRRAAEACRAERWWCLALLGFASHQAGDFAAADSAYAAALALMPPAQRERWTDVRVLLPDDEARAWRRAAAAGEREALERRFWWLADPLWMRPGNERRTEHFTRHVYDGLQRRAEAVEYASWGSDLRELLLRYGWTVSWERVRPGSPVQDRPGITSYFAPHSRHFLPPVRLLGEPGAIAAEEWPLRVPRAHSSYAPAYARRTDELEHQLAAFRRGDSALLVAAFVIPADSLARDSLRALRLEAALLLAADEAEAPAAARAVFRDSVGTLQLMAAPGAGVVSLEAVVGRRAARARYGLPARRAAGGVALSDLLLLREGEALPTSLEEAAPLARPSLRARAGERLPVFWEVYGVAPGMQPLTLAVSLRRTGGGSLRRAAERIGLLGTREPVRLRWQEAPPDAAGVLARTVVLTLPERLPAGDYLVELRLGAPGGEVLAAERRLRVEG